MARRTPPTTNGYHTNANANGPPPSTLAAQIVQNQTRQPTSQPKDESAIFRGLLHEILHNQGVQETDVNVNAQLVSVVVQAGLTPLTTENPFADWDVLLQQANDSIAVIETTVKRQPEVLQARQAPDDPPLVLTILLALIGICGRPKCEDVPSQRLLESLLSSLESSLDLWQQMSVLRSVLQDCVDDIFSIYDETQISLDSVDLTLPPARSLTKLCSNTENSVTMPQGNTTSISDPTRAFLVALDFIRLEALDESWRQNAYLRAQQALLGRRPGLLKSQLWDRALEQLLRAPFNWVLSATLIQKFDTLRLSASNQRMLASTLLDILGQNANVAKDAMLTALRSMTSSEHWSEMQEDLRIAIATWYGRFESQEQAPDHIAILRESLRAEDSMTDGNLETSFQHLAIAQGCSGRRPRLRKRRRVSEDGSDAKASVICRRAAQYLTGVETADLSAMPDVAPSVYMTLSEDKQCAAWQVLADLAEVELDAAISTVSRLLEVRELHETKRPRILSVLAVRACVERTSEAAYTSLTSSSFGKHVLNAIQSSLRELRLAAAQSIACFLRQSLPECIRSQNRQLALEWLRGLSDRNIANEQETLIATWGQVALSCEDAELNLVLLRLVEYLGHSNPLICALSFNEIETIAAARGQAPKDLFSPFWRSIAVTVVQDLHSRPQKTQQLCDLLNMDMDAFLTLTQQQTLPYLVLNKKKDVLQRIAHARGNGCTIYDICMQPISNLASILALLLSQSASDAEDLAFACLVEVAPELRQADVASLVKLDAVLVACEMLKLCGDEGVARKSRAYQAFQTLAHIAERAPGQRKAHPKSSKAVSQFLENQVLGILTHFSGVLENVPGANSTPEKVRCLKGLADMLILGRGKLSFALPQIRSCLHSGLEQPQLCEVAYDTWLTMIPVLEAEDIPEIVGETFVLIARHWSAISPDLQQKTHEMLGQLVKSHNTMLQENIMTLPSLEGIPLLSKFAAEFERLRTQESVESHCKAFAKRLKNDSGMVTLQAIDELVPFLETHQDFVHDTAASEHPSPVLADLLCALLDATVKYSSTDVLVARQCGKALGIIGCLDPNRVEATRRKRNLLVLSNFDKASEVIDWVVSLLEDVLVKSFKSVTNARAQGFVAYTMQELLGFCNFTEITALRPRSSQMLGPVNRWNEMPEQVRTTLTPLLTSKYRVSSGSTPSAPDRAYPSFSADDSHGHWLRFITFDLMFKGKGDNAKAIFELLARIIRGNDLGIARFVFPYAALNVIIGGTETEFKQLVDEFMSVLESSPSSSSQQETIQLCSESVFAVLDYMSTWLREKRKELSETRSVAYKTGHSPNEFDEARDMGQIETVERFLASIPAAIIADQAMDCRSYARALFHWEQHIRKERSRFIPTGQSPLIPTAKQTEKEELMYERLQDIYGHIDEPDGLEGIAAHLPLVTEEQQTINHAKAGRWTAAQAWYELQLAENPTRTDLQHDLLRCLQETGQYAPLLRYANSFLDASQDSENLQGAIKTHLPLAAEACWMTQDFRGLEQRLQLLPKDEAADFNLGIGRSIVHASEETSGSLNEEVSSLRQSIVEGLSMSSTDSLQTCHSEMVKLHVLYEMEAIMATDRNGSSALMETFEKRLNAVGAYVHDKQYILGIRRAAMRLRPESYSESKAGSLWLATARLARQSKHINSAYNAVLKAYDCEDKGAKIEEARLLWHEGHQRQAIQSLQAAIDSGIFEEEETSSGSRMDVNVSCNFSEINGFRQNPLAGKAMLLLAKWLDASGQSQTKDMTDRYQLAARRHQRWEKGHYYLGKHYTKLLEAQKALPRDKQTQAFLTGDLTKLVIDNSLRSIPFGNKYWHETIPRILTLWLQLGMDAEKRTPREDQATFDKRVKSLQACNRQLQKYFERVPPYVFYHALPQLISRITHPHPDVWNQICNILTRIAANHPSQTLWSLLAVTKSRDRTRVERGQEVLNKLKDPKNKPKNDASGIDLRTLIAQGIKLCDGLLLACEQPIEARTTAVSLTKNLMFNHKLAPSNLVVPVEATLTATAPPVSNSETIRKHKAFAQDKITIAGFEDSVLVLNSLQRPRKITVRGSDGRLYGLLCKPKDDLRKDQRLMEFNGIINRALKRNTDSSKRRLCITTYAVTPLSEESGILEWVEGIKPIRDILLGLYSRKGIRPNYNDIKKSMDRACEKQEDAHIFAEEVLNQFTPALHEWFTETYPEPETWLNSRLRYSRSAAVMSIVGHILGLGDRHGENILLEEGTGGVFHVDFNCLFDKGLTFEKPELVPFRLTHNMVDAMGPYGYEGPFRKCCELTLGLLRQERDTLMTVLETFLYDPTTDFVGKKKRCTAGVPETPADILESVATKLKGLLRGESVPLSVEGYVDALIQQATSHFNLASMYIGWCSFL
ncbi:hypothetical protein AC578_8070 [Pseudocercospora eumusae]|uniref:non-specific serine/threonine protein kinase n=1 Tax=Pseudocercospora eumusae TaxID=321146 RepID=A0A139H7Y0_9PEZI|nr:hypothetical protein AC578_8070 [Pseudocercospora eumusae]